MSNSTTTFSHKATETGKTVFYIKNEDGTRREVDGDVFARTVDSTIKRYIRELTAKDAAIDRLTKERDALLVACKAEETANRWITGCYVCGWDVCDGSEKNGVWQRHCGEHWPQIKAMWEQRRAALALCGEGER